MIYFLMKVVNILTAGDEMKIQVDDVKPKNRKHFRDEVLKAIDGNGNVYFTLDKAIVETVDGYIITEESLELKSKTKIAVNKVISDFRLYQFNQD